VNDGPIVVGIGEALFDCLPDHRALGGAPVNVAVHAHRMLAASGGRGVVVSRAGRDELGAELVAELASRGMGTEHIQWDGGHPTGTVAVSLDGNGGPSYRIEEDVAWDHLEYTPALRTLARSCSAVCFGSLAQRSPATRDAIRMFLADAGGAERVFDANLRQDYFDGAVLRSSLEFATVAKLNEEELGIVGSLVGLGDAGGERLAWRLMGRFDLRLLAVTRGAAGTLVFADGVKYEATTPRMEREADADSVGAGDACLAALTCGLLLGWTPPRMVEAANEVGAFVASRRGATPALTGELVSRFAPEPEALRVGVSKKSDHPAKRI
jgi:fructokinase